MKINLAPAVYNTPLINSVKELKARMDANRDFIIVDMSSPWNGAYTTIADLKRDGYTHAQIRYGKNNTKVWYGEI